jgi:hypothetical protein
MRSVYLCAFRLRQKNQTVAAIKTIRIADPTKDVKTSIILHRPPRAHPRPIKLAFQMLHPRIV